MVIPIKYLFFFLTFFLWSNPKAFADQPMEVVENWMSSCSMLDIEGMVNNYFEDATSFLTTHRELVIGKEGVGDYLRGATATMDPKTMKCRFKAYTNSKHSDKQVTIAGWDKITGEIEGVPFINEGRTSFILNKRSGIWKISHFHRSPLPVLKNTKSE